MSKAFRDVSAAAGSPATGILKPITDQMVANSSSVRPAASREAETERDRDRELELEIFYIQGQ